jgi:hypothetical protein
VTPVAIRVALVVGAVCALAWFANGFRALDLESQGLAATQRAQKRGHLPASELRAARQAFEDARNFSADQGPLLSEGFLLAANRRRKDAYRLARRVIASEPENLQAWFLARQTAPDRRRAGEAGRRIDELSPSFFGAVR